MHILIPRARLGALWVLSVAAVAACGEVTNTPTPDVPPRAAQTADEALLEDARSYAKQFKVSTDEAGRRLRAQEKHAEVIVRLRGVDPDRMAGLWIEHQPTFRIVVRLKGNAPAGASFHRAAAGSPTPVHFVTGAASSETEVMGRVAAALPRFKEAIPGLAGTEMDVKTGDIVLTVHAPGAAGEAAKGKAAQLSREAGNPVRVQLVDAPVQDGQVRGGANLTNCTSGFVVSNSAGTRGVLTAGHCPDSQGYSGFDGTTTSMTWISEIRDADQDVQWHTTPLTELPEFYADLTTSARILTGRRLRSSTAVGNTVCHRGLSSGYSCGSVESTTYQPTYTDACPGTTCASVWIKVSGPDLKCYPGDSGGPWFNGQTAFGIYKGQSSTGTGVGQCSFAIYMSTDYVSGLGVSLLYGA